MTVQGNFGWDILNKKPCPVGRQCGFSSGKKRFLRLACANNIGSFKIQRYKLILRISYTHSSLTVLTKLIVCFTKEGFLQQFVFLMNY